MVVVGREDGSGRDGSGTGSEHCSDGPASCSQTPSWKADWISFRRFSTRLLKSTSMRRTFTADTASDFFIHSSKIRAFVTTSPENPKESKNFRETPCHLVLSASARIRVSSAVVARTCAAAARASAVDANAAAAKVCASATSALRFRSAN